MEEIIDISPSYNSDKSGKKKKETKKKKKEEKEEKIEYEPVPNESHDNYLPRYQHDFEVDEIPTLKAKKSSFLSNVDGLEAGHYLARSLSNQ